jgi:hypothetical protein
VDPLQYDYPQLTPFNYAGNKPITHIDLDGMQSTGDKPYGSEKERNKPEQIYKIGAIVENKYGSWLLGKRGWIRIDFANKYIDPSSVIMRDNTSVIRHKPTIQTNLIDKRYTNSNNGGLSLNLNAGYKGIEQEIIKISESDDQNSRVIINYDNRQNFLFISGGKISTTTEELITVPLYHPTTGKMISERNTYIYEITEVSSSINLDIGVLDLSAKTREVSDNVLQYKYQYSFELGTSVGKKLGSKGYILPQLDYKIINTDWKNVKKE